MSFDHAATYTVFVPVEDDGLAGGYGSLWLREPDPAVVAVEADDTTRL